MSVLLPWFDPARPVDPRTARQDKIELVWGTWLVDAPPDELEGYWLSRTGMRAVSRAEYGALVAGGVPAGEEGRTLDLPSIFTIVDRRDPICPQMKIAAGGRGRGEARPLFGGYVNSSVHRRHGPNMELRLSTYLDLNPTRYIAYQDMRGFVSGQHPSTWNLGSPRLMYRRRATPTVGTETVLDGNDNVILSSRRDAFAQADAWPIHLRRFWDGVRNLIDATLVADVEEPGRTRRVSDAINLRSVETYFEFRAESPQVLVQELGPIIEPLAAEGRTRDYPHGSIEGWPEVNSRVVRLRLRAGVWLKIYAKTNERVRFEIRHDLTEDARVLHGGAPQRARVSERGAHTHADPEMLYGWLASTGSAAAQELTDVFAYIARRRTRPAQSRTVFQLLRTIADAAENDRVADALMEILIVNGCVRTPRPSLVNQAVRRLEERGVLVRSRRYTRQLVLASEYEHARSQLGRFRRTFTGRARA